MSCISLAGWLSGVFSAVKLLYSFSTSGPSSTLKPISEKIDVTLPERNFFQGKIHPVSQVIDEVTSIFSEIGFSVEEGPDVESEYYNFSALNTPENHPARDMQDTFYLEHSKDLLLRHIHLRSKLERC